MGKALQAILVAATLVATSAPVRANTSVGTRSVAARKLRRTTVVTSDQSATATVRLPRRMATSLGDRNPGVRFAARGAGRILAWALVKNGITPRSEAPMVYGWAIGRCATPGCRWKGFLSQYVFDQNVPQSGGESVLPAGDYTFYLVTDGAPARVTLRFPALRKGKAVVAATDPATVDLPAMEPRDESVTSSDNTYWSGSSSDIEGPGLAIVNTWVDRGDAEGSGAAGLCVYELTEPPPDEAAYTPGCPAAFNPVEPVRARHTDVGYRTVAATLPTAAGGWYSDPAEVTGGTVALWLQF